MPDTLRDLFDQDREAYAFFQSLPMFIQDQLRARSSAIGTAEALSGAANELMRDGLKLEPYRRMFEDETDSRIDLL